MISFWVPVRDDVLKASATVGGFAQRALDWVTDSGQQASRCADMLLASLLSIHRVLLPEPTVVFQGEHESRAYAPQWCDLPKPGQRLWYRRRRAKNVGFAFQKFNLLPALTASENVAVPLVINGASKKDARGETRCRWEWGWATAFSLCRRSYPVVSSNAWPLPERWFIGRVCLWRRSRQANILVVQAQVEQNRTMLALLSIRAPVDGTIPQVNTRPGEYISTMGGQSLMLVGNLQPLQVRVNVDEEDLPRLKLRAPTRAKLRGDPAHEEIALSFVRLEPYVVPKISLPGANPERLDTRVIQVIYAVDPTSQLVSERKSPGRAVSGGLHRHSAVGHIRRLFKISEPTGYHAPQGAACPAGWSLLA